MAAKNWSVNAYSDWRRKNLFLNLLRLNFYRTMEHAGVHVALLGLNLSVTRYARAPE